MTEVELQQIGQYNISELLRTSSTSVFYRAKQRKKEIIIKKLITPLVSNEHKEAFLARAKQLKKLKDRSIVNILDANFQGDYAYLVMEYTTGESMQQRIAPGTQMPPDEVKRILSPAAGSLHYAHVSNIFHGNLHPGNLLVKGNYADIQLTEFSLTTSDLPSSLDDEDFAIPYMAPEQLHGQPTAVSDQYALAVMVYEWLCGRRPYEATERELLYQQQQASIPAPSSFNAAISPATERVIMQALAYDPQQRFPHIQAFSDHYLSALMGFSVKTPTPPVLNSAHSKKEARATRTTRTSLPNTHTPLPNREEPSENPLAVVENTANKKEARTTRAARTSLPNTPAPLSNREEPSENPSALAENASEKIEMQEPITTPQYSTLLAANTSHPDLSPQIRSIDSKVIVTTTEQMEIPETPADPDAPPSRVRPFGDPLLYTIVVDDLRQGGILSQSLPGYEERPAQITMASTVARAITENVPAIIEAGTGTGKSLAYLVPIVRSGDITIVSTANKALQEQLFYKDIPFVQKHIKHFEAALVKGVNNYVCLDRVDLERSGMQFYTKNKDFQRLLDVTMDPDSTFNGDFETLGFQLPGDIRARVATDSDQCAWNKCSFFEECYVRQMRDRAARAQIVVVNHTLLLLDAAMGGFLLPERDLIVLDEAHHLEEEATRSFTITIGPNQVQTLLAQRMLKDHSQLTLQDETSRAAMMMWQRLEQIANPGFKSRVNLVSPLEEGLRLATALTDLTDSLRKRRPKNLDERDSQLYDKLLKRAQNLAENVRMVFSVAEPDKFVYYVERAEGSMTRGNMVLQASAAPLDVTSWLKERLFDKCNVISTSATLATIGPNPTQPQEKGPNFSYFRRRIGLSATERSDVLEQILPLAFDYENNALLYLPRNLPEPTFGPGAEDYTLAIAREMYKLVKLSRGRAFLLFSSKRMLDHAYELMAPHLPYPLLKQGDMTRLELTKRFRQEEGAILFGLKSFWEGVDIAGEALSLVVIDKLPFDPPDDPVHEARVAQMKAANENWFGTYVLPQAVLRLKQGIGRLLRTREDRGVMAILDTRLHTKGYGKQVLSALPPARRTASLRDIEQFFLP